MPNEPEGQSTSRWGFAATALVLVATLGAVSLAAIPDALIGDETLTRRIAGQVASIGVQNALFVAVPVVILMLLRARPRPEAFGLRRPERLAWTVGAVILAFVVYVGLAAGLGALLGIGDRQDSLPRTLGATESAAAGIVIALAVTTLAPVGEEFLMRGVVFAGVRDGARAWMSAGVAIGFAALVNGAIFGALHGATEPIFLPILVLFGAILCLLYQATGTLYAPIALHLINNTVAMASALDWALGDAIALGTFSTLTLAGAAWLLARVAGPPRSAPTSAASV